MVERKSTSLKPKFCFFRKRVRIKSVCSSSVQQFTFIHQGNSTVYVTIDAASCESRYFIINVIIHISLNDNIVGTRFQDFE